MQDPSKYTPKVTQRSFVRHEPTTWEKKLNAVESGRPDLDTSALEIDTADFCKHDHTTCAQNLTQLRKVGRILLLLRKCN